MLIDTILKQKGGVVQTVSAEASLTEAANLLDRARIGAVVAVTPDGDLAGVLSERDIVRQFARHGQTAMTMSVSDAMTRGVITAVPSESVDTCLSRMTDRRIRHLPIVSDGMLKGIVSIGDLVKYKMDEVAAEAEAMTSYIKSG